jgi:hypothetical protein
MTYNLKNQLEEAETEFGLGKSNDNEWYNLEVGSNRVRILTQFQVLPYHYVNNKFHLCVGKENCPFCKQGVAITTKWLCYVWDRRENDDLGIKPASLPYTVIKEIQKLQDDPEWSFETLPMNYDVTIVKTMKKGKDGKDRPSYSVTGSPKREDVPAEKLEQLAKLNSPEKIKENMKAKRLKELGLEQMAEQSNDIEYPTEEISPEDVPY